MGGREFGVKAILSSFLFGKCKGKGDSMGFFKSLADGAKRLLRITRDNSPIVLQIVSSTGTILAVVTAVKATPKAIQLIRDAEAEKGEKLTVPEVVGATWKCYALPAAATVIAVGSGWASLHESAKHNARLATALASGELALAEYQQKTREVVGEKKEREIRDEIARDKAAKAIEDGTEPYPTGFGEDIFVLAYDGSKFKSTQETNDRAAIAICERLVGGEMFVEYNELRYEMGLGPTDIGRYAYFTPDNMPKFEYTHTPGEPYVSVSFAPGCEPKVDIKGLYH